MQKLFNLLNNARSLNEDIIEIAVDVPEVKELIIEMNTMDQLYERGVDSNNVDLGDYSPTSKIIKDAKGQRSDHITLRDTGEAYDSEEVEVLQGGGIKTTMNTVKDGKDLQDRFGKNITGLTSYSRDKFKQNVRPRIREEQRKWLKGIR